MIFNILLLTLGVTVELPPEAKVRGADLTLGAIATVSGEDATAVARVQAVRLGYSPAPGYSRLLQAARIAREISTQASGVKFSFSGSRACRVWPEVELVSGAALEAAARAELERHLGVRDASFEALEPTQDVEVPSGKNPLSIQVRLEAEDVGPGRVAVPVQILVDGTLWRSVWTNWTVKLWESRPVLMRDAASGQTITADMLEMRRVPVSSTESLTLDMLEGANLAHAMRAGEELAPADVVRSVLVHTGATLMLEIKKSAVSARVAVTAEQQGSRGDRIRVRFLDSERTIVATVVERDLVIIDLGTRS